MTCNCKPIYLNGGERSGSTEWYHACPEHGVMSAWWNDPERVAERERKSIASRDLQTRAAEARRAARPTP
jgi:hypothetical protein